MLVNTVTDQTERETKQTSASPASKWEQFQRWLAEPPPKTKPEALAHFRQTAAYLSDPDIQDMIESEARSQMRPEIDALNEMLARSSILGQDEILR